MTKPLLRWSGTTWLVHSNDDVDWILHAMAIDWTRKMWHRANPIASWLAKP